MRDRSLGNEPNSRWRVRWNLAIPKSTGRVMRRRTTTEI